MDQPDAGSALSDDRVGHPAAAVLAALRGVIARAADERAFAALLEHLLAGPGRVLDPAGGGKWPAYVLETARVLGGDGGAAIVAAGAVACLVAAADIVDELADDEWGETRIASGRAVNAAVALGAVAQCCADELLPLLGPVRVGHIGALLAIGYLRAAGGEDLDLRLEADPAATEEVSHAMTQRKSGTLVALACEVGAAVATDDPAILAAAAAFGAHAGSVAQILNDLDGITHDGPDRGSDLRLRKKTLPVVYALRCAHEEGIAPLLAWYGYNTHANDVARTASEEEIVMLIRDLGGLQYAGIIADAHRLEARAIARRLMRRGGRPAVGGLRRLIPAVRWKNDTRTSGC